MVPVLPVNPPGTVPKIIGAVAGLLALALGLNTLFRSQAPPPPKTMTKEWQEASNERALEQKMNPISGIASDDYKGKGFVTVK
ncbi:hypothetical protein NM688_g7250 [Phlebia brevispora]|uniref:Uncharacterized protein n=1 Tax=Phlebia brevispora TaxID=194682 RepID=A0ACC1S7K2_9APHY|nr:hypothetical protein NM688_g7250 [Phlebia brevispora]